MDIDWLVQNAGALGAVTGALGGAWTLAMRARKAAYGWMSENFASKDDISRIETKVDTLVELHWQQAMRSAVAKQQEK